MRVWYIRLDLVCYGRHNVCWSISSSAKKKRIFGIYMRRPIRFYLMKHYKLIAKCAVAGRSRTRFAPVEYQFSMGIECGQIQTGNSKSKHLRSAQKVHPFLQQIIFARIRVSAEKRLSRREKVTPPSIIGFTGARTSQ